MSDGASIDDVYVILCGEGPCRICGNVEDLRFGVCFDCADYCKTDRSMAWDVRNPRNYWPVGQPTGAGGQG